MIQRQLGPNGLFVGAIGLGGMPMSITRERPAEADSVALLVRAADLGVTLWDTADAYCLDHTEIGHNERLFGKALLKLPPAVRSTIVVATKGGNTRPDGEWVHDGRPEHIRSAVDASLRALGVDSINLYQLHRVDENVPFADTVGAFAEARKAGKVKFVGLSNVTPAQIEEALKIVPIASVQNRLSPIDLSAESDGVLDKCREHGIAFLPYSPLGGMWGGAKEIGKQGELEAVSNEVKASAQQVVLAWLLSKYDRLIPIPGVSRVSSVENSAGAAFVLLNISQIARLDKSFHSEEQ
ncbi:MAG TPA: aldo/keto reductase [Capsulimonadaceae bacterium]|jgi:aryl-alcohol dehydrogenase-like predicted oxidoreductase